MNDDPRFWYAIDSQISVSSERFKHGTSSLKWEAGPGSSLTYTNPEAFRSIKWANNKCFALWFYCNQEIEFDANTTVQPMDIEFLTATESTPVARIWYHINYSGWRALGLRYALLPQFKNNLTQIHGIRITLPSNIPDGIYFLNGINFDYTHSTGPQADYQQPWTSDIRRLEDDPSTWLFNPKNIFHNRPWLEEQHPTVSDDDVNKVKDRWLRNLPYATWAPSAKPESFSKLQELAAAYGIKPNSISNIPLGKGAFYSPDNALDIQPFLLGPLRRTATTYQCHRHQKTFESEEGQNVWKLLLQLCDYLLEQGWSEGNLNQSGHLDIGYEIRNFPMCFVYIRDQLNEANRLQPIITSAIWIMYGHLLTEKQTSIMSTDIIHNYLTNVSRLIVCIPEPNELLRRLIAFRYTLIYSFENRIHEPLALDGTVHHHWMCHFEYTSYSLPDVLNFASDLNDTGLHFPDNIRRLLRRCVHTLDFCLIENNTIPPNLGARAGKTVACNGINMAKKCVSIGDQECGYDPFVAGMLVDMCPKSDKSIATYLKDGVDPVPLNGHLTLNSTAACIHRREDFFACIIGMGKNRRGLEIYGWLSDTNNYGKYVRNCSIFIVPPDDHGTVKYSNTGCAFPGWNWSHWPGTTCLLRPRSELFEGYCNLTAKNWFAGGTSIAGRDGMFSNDFFVWDIAFRRSVYCFDNRITVLTSNIKLLQHEKRPVITTLFQSNFSNLEKLEQTPFRLNHDEEMTGFPEERVFDNQELNSIIDHRNLCYYLHPKDNSKQAYRITLRRSEQDMIYCNAYYLIDAKQNPIIDMKSKKFKETVFEDNEKYFKTTKDKYGLGYIEHLNVEDSTASFVYTILIGNHPVQEWMDEFSHSADDPWSSTDLSHLPPLIILSKENDTHIFYDRDTDTTCYTCYSKDRLNVDLGLVRSFGQPCTAMIRGRGPGTVRISIATTDFMLNKTLWMVLKGKWNNAELTSDDENGCVHVRSEVMEDGDTKVTVWQRIYMPVEFHITQESE
ncbi:unnamed protein product [Adineta ricciae]|uniref:Uncharacterized protein n=1 Tax=Adineta ricciae TaxID=249248 RepID=A0A815DZL4_ADIRI|nr:unnamed protein product [Adineta ricciae]